MGHTSDKRATADAFFAERGFRLVTHGDYSADLLSAQRDVRLQPRYGSGATPAAAAARAQRRYEEEE